MQQLNIFLICLLSFCLTSFLVIGQNVKVQVVNTDPRGIIVQGESAILHIGLSQAKNNYIIYAKINGKIVYRLKNRKPESRFSYYPSTAKTGKYSFNLQVQYIAQGVLKNARLVYNYEVIKSTRTLARRFFLGYPNKIPCYRKGGRKLKVTFRGDTSQLKIYKDAKYIYLVPLEEKTYQLDIYHQGKKIDQLKFEVMTLPSPQVKLLNAKDSTAHTGDCVSRVLVTLQENPEALFLLDSIPRQLSVDVIELTHLDAQRSSWRSCKIRGNSFSAYDFLNYECTPGHYIDVKALKVSQIIPGQSKRITSTTGRVSVFRVGNVPNKIPLYAPVLRWVSYRIK